MYAAENRTELWQFNFSDARQLVEDLLLFELQLFRVGQVLPLTTSTDTEVLAEGGRAYITIYYKAHHLALGEGMLLAPDLHVAHIARGSHEESRDAHHNSHKSSNDNEGNCIKS